MAGKVEKRWAAGFGLQPPFRERILKRPVTVLMVSLVILELGAVGLFHLPISLLPTQEASAITLVTRNPGNDAQTIERTITIPLERALSDLTGLIRLSSRSLEGESRIHASFRKGVDLAMRMNQASERIQPILKTLPSDVNRPYLIEFNSEKRPVFAFSIKSESRSPSEVRKFVETEIKPSFRRVPGVSEILLSGGQPAEVQLILSAKKLASVSASPLPFGRSVQKQQVSVDVGRIQSPALRTVRFNSSIESVKELGKLPDPKGKLSLDKWARIKEDFRSPDSISRRDGKPHVSLYLKKTSNASTLAVARKARTLLEQTGFPADMKSSIILDRGRAVEKKLNNLIRACISGTLVAIIVLLCFLGRVRLTIVSALCIPFSVIGSFFILYLFQLGLNAMTLSALSLSAGLVIDNAVLLSERIHGMSENGLSSGISDIDEYFQSISRAMRASSLELLAGTGTTVIALLPIPFVSETVRQQFQDFIVSISAALVLSLFFALVLLPVLLHRFCPSSAISEFAGWQTWLSPLVSPIVQWLPDFTSQVSASSFLERHYQRVLRRLIHNKSFVIILCLLTCLLLPILFRVSPVSPNKAGADKTIQGRVTLKTGLHLSSAAAKFEELEGAARKNPHVSQVDTRIKKNRGFLYIHLKQEASNHRDRIRVMKDLERHFARVKDAFVHFSQAEESDSVHTFRFSFLGPRYSELKQVIGLFARQVQKLDYVNRVVYHFREPGHYLNVLPDSQKTAFSSPAQLARALQYHLRGAVVSKLHWKQSELDLRLKGDWVPENGRSALLSLPLGLKGGNSHLGDVAYLSESQEESVIYRKNKRRALSISVEMRKPAHEQLQAFVEQFFQKEVDSQDIDYRFNHKYLENQKSAARLALAILACLLAIYLLLGAIMESFSLPALILITIPPSLSFALTVYLVLEDTLSPVALFSLMMLAGLTANGAIVMVSTLERAMGDEFSSDTVAITDTLLDAAASRLRPLLITSATTVLGMTPLLLAADSGFWITVAQISISGTIISVPSVLFLTPTLYYWRMQRSLHLTET